MGVRVPEQVELWLSLSSLLSALFSGRLFTFFALLLLLLVVPIKLVSVLEDPLAFTVGLIVSEATLAEGTIGVNPLAMHDLALLPLAVDLHP